MTTPKRNEAVAWQERHRNRDGTWGAWSPCSKAYVDTFLSDPDGTYETRELVPASELAALQGEVSRLRAVLAAIRNPIAAAPEHAFGVHYEGPDQPSWPIRDEILSGIDKALNLEPPTDGR